MKRNELKNTTAGTQKVARFLPREIALFVVLGIFALFQVALLTLVCGAGIYLREPLNLTLKTSGDFVYYEIPYTQNVEICGLTEQGKNQTVLIIPEKLDGKKVSHVSHGVPTQKNIRKHLEQKYDDLDQIGLKSDCVTKVFIVADAILDTQNGGSWEFFSTSTMPALERAFFVPNTVVRYGGICRSNHLTQLDEEYYPAAVANLSYHYNYDSAPNDGYYWIDDYGYGKTIQYVPSDPVRAGYVFGGWYKEPECVQAWDFATDTLPPATHDEYYNLVYQETKLYAKWIAA